jgi:xylulokinase
LSLADCQTYLAATGQLPEAVGAIGGGSKSRFWMRLLASALDRTILFYEGGETGPAFGAARLARLAATGESPDGVCTKPAVATAFRPDPDLADAYRERLAKFQALYRAVSSEF